VSDETLEELPDPEQVITELRQEEGADEQAAMIRATCSAVDAAALSDAFLVRLPSEINRR
jgi:hypothetical protein